MSKIIKEIMNGVESSEYHKFTVPLLIDLNLEKIGACCTN